MNSRFLAQSKNTRSRLAGVMLVTVLAVTALAPVPAKAQFATADVNQGIANAMNEVKTGVVAGVTAGLIDAANYFVSNMAYQVALSIMGDCPGQKSCWSSKNWNTILRESAENAAATAITSAADASGLTGMGFNVCNPGLPAINLRFQLGLLGEEKPAAPRCSLSQITTGWDNMYSSLKDSDLKSLLNVSVAPGQSPMSFGLSAYTYKYEKKQEDTRTKYEDWATNKIAAQGFTDVKDPVSGRVMTPGSMVAQQMQNSEKNKEEGEAESTKQLSGSAIAAGAISGIAVTGVRVFVQTLTARAWNKLVKGLLSAEEAVSQDPDIIFNPEGILNPGLEQVQTSIQPQYASVKTRDVGEYDIISEFTVCGAGARGPNNCAMDAEFAAAVRMGDAEGLTLAEAFRRNLIADKPLISEKYNPEDNRRVDCYRDGYCESNLKKLRAARVVPVGWELAADLSPKKNPVTLKQAMDMFDQCGQGAGDPAYPFCHLVDPNWVLKVPPLQCRAMGYGSTPIDAQLAARAETCVDMQSCLKQNDSGTCENQWGYCTKEEHVWRFKAESCPAYYNSCRALTKTVDKTKVNYLTNTMDRGICSAANAGCSEYALDRKAAKCQWLQAGGCSGDSCLCKNSDTANCSCSGLPTAANLTCSVAQGEQSCVSPSGEVCRLSGGASCASNVSCSCTVEYSCRVAKGATSCYTTAGDITPVDDWQDSPSRFFTRAAATCDASNDGCSRLQSLAPGQSLNLIRNGSFEDLDDAAGDGTLNHARYWQPFAKMADGYNGTFSTDASQSANGSVAVLTVGAKRNPEATRTGTTETVGDGTVCAKTAGCPKAGTTGACLVPFGKTTCAITNLVSQAGIMLESGKIYTMSAMTADKGGIIQLDVYSANGNAAPNLAATDVVTSADLYVTDDKVNYYRENLQGAGCTVNKNTISLAWANAHAREVASCTFSLKAGLPVASGTVTIAPYAPGDAVYFDSVMLEEGYGTLFHEGSNGGNVAYGKVPPANLGCRGEDDDPAVCSSYAAVCRENEVGCEKFSPTDGSTALTGVATANDLCPAECVGYDAFKKQASLFDAEKFPEYFIPSTAQTCPVESVGCSAFTNLKTEKASYYSALRACAVADDPQQAVFYTWEGSDVTGYQLKTWHLKTTADEVPADTCCYQGECKPGSCSAASRPSGLFTQEWLSLYHADISIKGDAEVGPAGKAPCTALGGASMSDCVSRDQTGNIFGSQLGYCTRVDIENGDIDCREFYDIDGNRHYRRLDKLVEVKASCDLYRIEGSTKSDCSMSGGVWDASLETCLYRFDSSSSQACTEAEVGCRSYKGGASGDIRLLLEDDLESGTTGWNYNSPSTESLVVGGHSLKTYNNQLLTRQLGTTIEPGLGYTLTFWARGEGQVTASLVSGSPITCTLDTACTGAACTCTDPRSGLACIVLGAGGQTCSIASTGAVGTGLVFPGTPVGTTGEWKQYTLGPLSVPSQAIYGHDPMALSLTFTGSAPAYFLDNVSLRENRSDINVVENSWTTPASCDQTVDGAASPHEMVGCREYDNSQGQKTYLRSLAKLCRERSVGCQAYLDTRNSASPYPQTYNAVCSLATACTAAGAVGGSNCPCTYLSGVAQVHDACRVKLGETSCRFTLDGLDTNSSRVTDRALVPTDRLAYLVLKAGGSCSEATAGCRAVGVRQTSFEQTCFLNASAKADTRCDLNDETDGRLLGSCTVKAGSSDCIVPFDRPMTTGWTEKGLIDNPEKYSKTLCQEDAVRCEEYSASGSYVYYKDPGDQVCEYRDSVVVDGETRSGFFRKSASGQIIPCAPELLKGDKSYTMYRNADATCRLPQYGGSDNRTAGNDNYDLVYQGVCLDNMDGFCPCYAGTSAAPTCFVTAGQTTCGYQGWVGQCEAAQDQCEEFVDPLATSAANREGKPYYYRANTLDKTSCNGQASLVGGCVLLDQTSLLDKPYDAPYTYTLSNRQKGTGLVTPASCDPSCATASPAASCPAECRQRCVAIANGSCTCNPKTDPDCVDSDDNLSCRQDADCQFKTTSGSQVLNYGHCEGDFKYGLACAGDVDCNATAGERCLANGQAYSAAFTRPAVSFNAGNDANLIVKARLDRECSEWLSCESESPTWDEAAGKFKNVCTGFLSCKKNAENGQPGSCVEVVHDDHKRYTSTVYASRDTGWYGEDASGFTITDAYPMSYVLPVSVVPRGCVTAADPTIAVMNGSHVKTCKTTDNCGAGSMCMTFEGMCRQGDTLKTDAPCHRDSDCSLKDGEICARSYLATHRFGVVFTPNKACTTDSDCTALKNGADDNGTCTDNRCVWRYRSGTFAANDDASVGACRAYPQADAPFSDSTLSKGVTAADATYKIEDGYDVFGNPASKKPDWAAANVCTKANDCECDYLRVKYGTGTERFYTYPGNSSGPVTYDGLESATKRYASVFDNPGICVGGPNDGRRCDPNAGGTCSGDATVSCRKDAECTSTDPKDATKTIEVGPCVKTCGSTEDGGKCTVWSNVSYQRGWPGFCIDQDRSLNVNGAENQFACNLWLPVDQLNGAPDFANQYKEAGFNPSRSTVGYCTVGQGNALKGSYEPVVYREATDEEFLMLAVDDGSTTATHAHLTFTGPDKYTWDGDIPGSHKPLSFDANYTLPGDGTYETMGLNLGNVVAFHVTLIGDKNTFYLWPGNKWTWSGGSNVGDSHDIIVGNKDEDWTGNPSNLTCMAGDAWTGDWQGSCVGVRANFNSSGVFTSFESNSSVAETGVHGFRVMKIEALLRESCEEVDIVHDTLKNQDFPSMAQTNAVYRSPRNSLTSTSRAGSSPLTAEQRVLTPAAAVTPLEEIQAGNTYTLDVDAWLPIWASEGGSKYSLAGPTAAAAATDYGYPRVSDASKTTFAVAGAPFVMRNGSTLATAQATGLKALKQLFVKTWRRYAQAVADTFTGSYGAASVTDIYNSRNDSSGTAPTTILTAPRVAAVNNANCSSSIDGLCGEETPQDSTHGGMTINDVLPGSDITAVGSYKATIKFYAMADKDHMPIRRVTFDYSDVNTGIVPNTGWFKNHRGCDPKAATCDEKTRICGSNDDFDTQPQACDDRFFSYVHTYRCTAGMVKGETALPECSDSDPRYPCQRNNSSCVFKPRVQIMDNWGLCNGSCPGGPGGLLDAVCMNSGTSGVLSYKDGDSFNPNALDSKAFSANECIAMKGTDSASPYGENKYSYKVNGVTYIPWTAYGGEIIVKAQ